MEINCNIPYKKKRVDDENDENKAPNYQNVCKLNKNDSTTPEEQQEHGDHKGGDPPAAKLARIASQKNRLGFEQYEANNYQNALNFYKDAISLCPDSALYHYNRGSMYEYLQDFNSALTDARNAIRLDPSFGKAYVLVARCCLALGDLIVLEQVVKTAEVNAQTTHASIQPLVQHFQQLDAAIQTNYDQKAYRKVVYYLDSALNQSPFCIRYRLLKAECLAYLGSCDEALDIAVDVMKMDSTSADAIYVRGLCLYYTDNLEKGILHFESALILDPDHYKSKQMRSKCKKLKEMKENANMLFQSGRYREAHEIYTDALMIDEQNKDINSKLLYNRALVNTRIGALREAVADCNRVLELNAQYLKALLLRARCHKDLENFEEAVADYETALNLENTTEIEQLLSDAKFALKKSMLRDYYTILGIGQNVSHEEIKKAYHKKALEHHPDRHSTSSVEKRKEEELKFKEVGEAYAILSDANKKASYDNGQDIEEQEQDNFARNE
ncbi:dnaJ homolog subfamily C member 7-like [Drosophila pseudoobscura]|uniref:DnaJ homolog subfamily C member 7-like n=1 Tax=Drosophila pseudoobscura pseudoobscura TaxID=46245 RepID=A0A6I8UXM0_DROPS|nr:dnaJ homolog subfamily C member 7 [Drosophila pseudoobscura]